MTRVQARESARELLEIVPLVMRTVAAELRAAGELPAPAHFGLLSILSDRPRMLTELASIQGVSLPTMSNSITAMVDRGWVKRGTPDEGDRRVIMIEVTATGKAALERVARAAEAHLAEALVALDAPSRRRLHGGLGVLRKIFAGKPPNGNGLSRKGHRTSARRRPYVSQ
jgi:DNA-binding MarR family transcriptional regulator